MQDGRPLTPLEISQKLGFNHNTVRVYCRELASAKYGLLKSPSYGYYVSNSQRVGVGGGFGVLVHNVQFVFGGLLVERGVRGFEEEVGGVGIKIRFGFKNRKVSAWISCDRGMNYAVFCLAVKRFYDVVFKETGYYLDRFPCKVSCEFNQDFNYLSFDGLSCVTFKSFLGDMERIYNKNGGLRSEVKIQNTNLQAIYDLLKGGVTPYHSTQLFFRLEQKLDELIDVLKFQNRSAEELKVAIKGFLEKQRLKK